MGKSKDLMMKCSVILLPSHLPGPVLDSGPTAIIETTSIIDSLTDVDKISFLQEAMLAWRFTQAIACKTIAP